MKATVRPEFVGQEHPVLGILQAGVEYEVDFSANWLEEVKQDPPKKPKKGAQEETHER